MRETRGKYVQLQRPCPLKSHWIKACYACYYLNINLYEKQVSRNLLKVDQTLLNNEFLTGLIKV